MKRPIKDLWIACGLISASMFVGGYLGYHGKIQEIAYERDNIAAELKEVKAKLKAVAPERDYYKNAVINQNHQIAVFEKAMDAAMLEFCIRDYRTQFNIKGDSMKPVIHCTEELN